jgi:uncharacterized membrane protein
MINYLITMVYLLLALVAGFAFPRLELEYFPSYVHDAAVGSALATLGAIASGMMSLTAIVFSIAYITVQFNAIAYSPRLALWYANSRRMFPAMGIFIATFVYTLWMMAWVDRGGNGSVPLMSSTLVVVLLIASIFTFVVLIRGLSELQISNTLHLIGRKGRAVIAEMYPQIHRPDSGREHPIERTNSAERGPVAQAVRYSGEPRTIAKIDTLRLVRMAEKAGAVIEIACAVGDTLSDDTCLWTFVALRPRFPGASSWPRLRWRSSVPSSRIRNILFGCWLMSRSRHCLPPLTTQPPLCRRSTKLRIFCDGWDGTSWR